MLDVEFAIDSKILALKQNLNNTFASAVQLIFVICRTYIFQNKIR